MEAFLKTLPAILKAAGDSAEVTEAACLSAWKHAAGDGLRDLAVPLRLNEKTLIVAVPDATWRKQMQYLSGPLLFRLNSILGQPLVTFLEFREDPNAFASIRSPLHTQSTQVDQANLAVPLELISAAAEIKDNDLRRVFLGAATSCIRRFESGD